MEIYTKERCFITKDMGKALMFMSTMAGIKEASRMTRRPATVLKFYTIKMHTGEIFWEVSDTKKGYTLMMRKIFTRESGKWGLCMEKEL